MIDVFEVEDALYVEVGLPGVLLDDVTVQAEGYQLVIWASRPEDVSKRRYRLRGRALPRSFLHDFMLPPEARVDLATAIFRHGLLQVKIPLDADAEVCEHAIPVVP